MVFHQIPIRIPYDQYIIVVYPRFGDFPIFQELTEYCSRPWRTPQGPAIDLYTLRDVFDNFSVQIFNIVSQKLFVMIV